MSVDADLQSIRAFASANDRDPEAAHSRTPEHGGRLNVELRLLGMIAVLWTCSIVQAAVWAWIQLGPDIRLGMLPWVALLVPQVSALTVLLVTVTTSLPGIRWPRAGPHAELRNPTLLLILGFPALLFVWPLQLRDRRYRRISAAAAPHEIEGAFQSLIRLPRVASLRFLGWLGLAYLADAIILGLHSDWSRGQFVATAILWLAVLGPLAAIVNSRARAILRPEYLSAPRAIVPEFRQSGELHIRLAVNASIASLGAVAAPLAAGYLWLSALSERAAVHDAQNTATRLLTLTRADRYEELGRELARNPRASVYDGGRNYGHQEQQTPALGSAALASDEGPQFIVERMGPTIAVVPIEDAPVPGLPTLLFSAIFCLASSIVSIVAIARDVSRDVVRASTQVAAVAKGEAPAPLRLGSLSTRELRQLVQAVDRLVSRITEANVAKYIAIEKSKEADRLKSQFLANMSHDLRSPLNSILGFSELLMTGIDGQLSEEQRDMVSMIHRSGRYLLQQIDDILDTAKIDAGRMETHPEPTPPATLITRAIANAKRRQGGQIEYPVEVAPGLPPAFVDPYRTVQALENVLLFAGERMPHGTVAVSIRQGHTEDGRMIFVEVQTPVRPATAAQLASAREGFYRLPGHRGLGLGVPIASSILELQGGGLSIEDLGEGMSLTLRLIAPEPRRHARFRT